MFFYCVLYGFAEEVESLIEGVNCVNFCGSRNVSKVFVQGI